jgi:hypothetical protein
MEKNDEKKVKKDGDVEDTDNKEGKDKDRVKKAEKNDEKEEEADSNSDTISFVNCCNFNNFCCR